VVDPLPQQTRVISSPSSLSEGDRDSFALQALASEAVRVSAWSRGSRVAHAMP